MAHPFFKVLCPPNENGTILVSEFDGDGNQICMTERQSKYHVGDILWVRETWGIGIQLSGGIVYKADYTDRATPLADSEKWKPSIHMPKEAASLFLRVTGVRVERLQDISEDDTKAEGITSEIVILTNRQGFALCNLSTGEIATKQVPLVKQFKQLWDSLNAENGYGWDANPWVWVYEFERIDKEVYSKL